MIYALNILKELKSKSLTGATSLSVLLDPDKIEINELSRWLQNIPKTTDYIFVGGSKVENGKTEQVVKNLKTMSALPIILFPGDVNQITSYADGLLFLTLMSGENPKYLIRQQIKSVKHLKNTSIEVIPTAYLLIDGGKTCTTENITGTTAIPQTAIEKIVDIAMAAQYSGKQLIYLEAGSGAHFPVKPEIISKVKAAVSIPIIVGGGIRTDQQKQKAYKAGADVVVMGTVFEE